MSDEISILVGNVCAEIRDWASNQAWHKSFNPTDNNKKIFKEAVELIWQNKYDLVFLVLFMGIEAEAKRLLKDVDLTKEKPDKIIAALLNSDWVSEYEFHFLNGLRALRNEIAHGHPQESSLHKKIFIDNEVKIGVLIAILLLMLLQSKSHSETIKFNN